MSQLKKRERASNFDKSEIRLLTELVTKHRSVIENKKTEAVANKEKEAAWSTIAKTFNAVSSGTAEPTSKTLKLIYESLKKCTKKKMTLHRQELYRTGGGPSDAPAFDDVEEKVLAICSNISGLDSRNDSDDFADITDAMVPAMAITYNEEEISIGKNTEIEGLTPDAADINASSAGINKETLEGTEDKAAHIVEVMDPIKEDDDTHSKWSIWNPKALKSKVSQALNPSKASVTAKLDQLSAARLELVQFQKELVYKEHLFIKEEHELKMLHLHNEEARKLELHELMLVTMQQRNTN